MAVAIIGPNENKFRDPLEAFELLERKKELTDEESKIRFPKRKADPPLRFTNFKPSSLFTFILPFSITMENPFSCRSESDSFVILLQAIINFVGFAERVSTRMINSRFSWSFSGISLVAWSSDYFRFLFRFIYPQVVMDGISIKIYLTLFLASINCMDLRKLKLYFCCNEPISHLSAGGFIVWSLVDRFESIFFCCWFGFWFTILSRTNIKVFAVWNCK